MGPRKVKVTHYQIIIAIDSVGFNEWRHNIMVWSDDPTTLCDIRFVDNPALFKQHEKVRENGPSQLYLPLDAFASTVDLLRNEKPLYIILYEPENMAIIQSIGEPPGEGE
jgi:hypothetical protein